MCSIYTIAQNFTFVKSSVFDKIKKGAINAPKNKKLREPFLPTLTEVETPQVTPSKLPYGTRNPPLSAATFLS